MKRIAQASIALLAPLALLACAHRSSDPADLGELAQSDPGVPSPDPGVPSPDPGVPSPQPGTGLYDAGLAPTPGTSPAPTDRSIGPSEAPTMPSSPGTDPGTGYPAPPGDHSDDHSGDEITP